MINAAHKNIVETASDLQHRAANPDHNVWVMASAGTGKTTVLVERFIRLVLSGTPPERILCLTYTKAAATQMKERILKRLSAWVSANHNDLVRDLSTLTDRLVTDDILRTARGLFGHVLDHIDMITITTIHAFCQSLLARFQIESGINQTPEIMAAGQDIQIMQDILYDLLENVDEPYIERLAQMTADQNWYDLIKIIINNKDRFQKLQHDPLGVKLSIDQVCDVKNGVHIDEIKRTALGDAILPFSLLELLPNSNHIVAQIKQCDPLERGALFDQYAQIFLTKAMAPRVLKIKNRPDLSLDIDQEQQRIIDVLEQEKNMVTAQSSYDLYTLSCHVLDRYSQRKSALGLLDYDDLIDYTLSLLSNSHYADWVRFKMDGGIDHVLLDEAQDTSPTQWRIIAQIVEDYFAGLGRRDPEDRTLFVVGDTKQSIFSFQGADPKIETAFHTYFNQQGLAARRPIDDVPMVTSFRTARDILTVVDACNAWGYSVHQSGVTRSGRVELYPFLVKPERKKELIPWVLPDEYNTSSYITVVNQAADKIQELLTQKIALPSKNGVAIEPHDILILLRNRNHFPAAMIQALRLRNIPVAGLDRFILTDDIATKDIISVLRWSLFPDDNLTLSTILVSPLVGWDHHQLGQFITGHGTENLWAALGVHHPLIHAWLSSIMDHIRTHDTPNSITYILERPCPGNEISARRAFFARLGPACQEALNQLLSYAYSMDQTRRSPLSFLHHIDHYPPEIKREMEGDHNANGVRIMTIHGAKGLEAPVVFMIDTLDTTQSLQKHNILQWVDAAHPAPIPLWTPRADDRGFALRQQIENDKRSTIEEYHRLLYVAMTRAKDYLIVMGAEPTQGASSESWYFKIKAAMEKSNAYDQDGVLVFGEWVPEPSGDETYATQDTPDADNILPVPLITIQTRDETEDQIWVHDRALSIGRQWHSVLERAMPHDNATIDASLADWIVDLPDITLNIARTRIAALRAHPDYGFLFEAHGATEVPFITTTDDGTARGRIDRLVKTNEALWIIDYKTHIDASNNDQIAQYRDQLQGYAAALNPISQGLPIHMVLVDIAAAQIYKVEET